MWWHQVQGVFCGNGIPGALENGNNLRVGWEKPRGNWVVDGWFLVLTATNSVCPWTSLSFGLGFHFLSLKMHVSMGALGLTHLRSLPAPGPGFWKEAPGRGDGGAIVCFVVSGE